MYYDTMYMHLCTPCPPQPCTVPSMVPRILQVSPDLPGELITIMTSVTIKSASLKTGEGSGEKAGQGPSGH